VTIPIKNGLNQGDALSRLLFNFALTYAIRRVQANQKGLKLNCTHQLLVYADDVNMLGRSIHTIRKNTEALVVTSKETGLGVNAEKTKYSKICNMQHLQDCRFARYCSFLDIRILYLIYILLYLQTSWTDLTI
jgi:hypothetical protein